MKLHRKPKLIANIMELARLFWPFVMVRYALMGVSNTHIHTKEPTSQFAILIVIRDSIGAGTGFCFLFQAKWFACSVCNKRHITDKIYTIPFQANEKQMFSSSGFC